MQLESVTFAANFGFGRKFVKVASIFWPCVLVALKQISTNCLHTVRFECQLEDLVDCDLSEVDMLLARPTFSRLKIVTFALADSDLPIDLDETIQMALPRTTSRGILQRQSLLHVD